MGLFGFGKKNTDTKPAKGKAEVPAKIETRSAVPKAVGSSAALLGMRITEKASVLSETASVYTFNVSADANKRSVSEAVTKLYKVTPVKVHITNIPAKRVFVRGKRGVKRGGRKAYVYLKKGEKIDIA